MRDTLLTTSILAASIYITPSGATSLLSAGAKCNGTVDDSSIISQALTCAQGTSAICSITQTNNSTITLSTGGDGLLEFPGNAACVLGSGTLTLGASASGQRMVLEGGPFPTPGGNTSLFSSASLGSVLIYGPKAQIVMNSNTGVRNLALVPAEFWGMSFLGSGSTNVVTLGADPPYNSGDYAATTVPVTGSCFFGTLTGSFASNSPLLTLSRTVSCVAGSTFTIGFGDPQSNFSNSDGAIGAMPGTGLPPLTTNGAAPISSTGTNTNWQLENIIVLGASTCLDARSKLNRDFSIRNVYADCDNGILLGGVGDEGEIDNLHMYPFLNAHVPPAVTIDHFIKVGTGSGAGVAAVTTVSPGLNGGDLVEISGEGSDPGIVPPTGQPTLDGKWQISAPIGSSSFTFTLQALPVNANLPLEPAVAAPLWRNLTGISGSSFTAETAAVVNWEANRRGRVLAYDGSSLSGSSTGLHINNVSSGGWTEVVYLANATYTTMNDVACSDSGGADPNAVCIALSGTLDALSATNIGAQSYPIALLDTTSSASATYANIFTNFMLSSSHSSPFSVIHAGVALSIGNLKSTESNYRNNLANLASWQQGCATASGCAGGASNVGFSGPLIIDGGVLSSTGFNPAGLPPTANQLILGSGTTVSGTPQRGALVGAPYNDQQGSFQNITGSVSGAVPLAVGTRRALFNNATVTGTITLELPPAPKLGDTACVSTSNASVSFTFADSTGSTLDVHGMPSMLAINKTACAVWAGGEWDGV